MSTHRILVVEDNRDVARTIEACLKRLGYAVVGVVDNGEEALRLAVVERPALALLDIELVGPMDGFAVAERLQGELDVPTVFLTGQGDEATLERVRRSNSFGYLLKPFRPAELKGCLELALQRHAREARLARMERAFSAAFRSIADAVVLADAAGTVTYLNEAAERLTGRSSDSAVGQRLATVVQASQEGRPVSVEALLRPATGGSGDRVREFTLHAADGRAVPVEVSVATIRDRGEAVLGTVLVCRDVSERKQLEADLRRSQAEMRSLAGHLQQAREEERTRIAREIHDELGQMLTALKLDLGWLEKRLATAPTGDTEPLLAKVRSMSELFHSLVATVRRLATELRPGLLDTLGLEAAVEWHVHDFEARSGLACSVQANLRPDALDRSAATALFRILQESLTNVARHARARTVHVRLEEQAGRVVLEVQDDGRGVTPDDLHKPGAFGLLGMRERVATLGGVCDIKGAPGRGTTVLVSVPAQPAAPKA